MCSLHANSARDAVTKICTLPLLAGSNISTAFVVPTVASCFDMVVHCHRNNNGHRFVAEILAVGNRVENGIIETYPLFRHIDGELVPVAAEVPSPDKFLRSGYQPSTLLEGAPAANRSSQGRTQSKKTRAKTS